MHGSPPYLNRVKLLIQSPTIVFQTLKKIRTTSLGECPADRCWCSWRWPWKCSRSWGDFWTDRLRRCPPWWSPRSSRACSRCPSAGSSRLSECRLWGCPGYRWAASGLRRLRRQPSNATCTTTAEDSPAARSTRLPRTSALPPSAAAAEISIEVSFGF